MRRRPLHQRDIERLNLPRRFWTARFAQIQGKAQEIIGKYLASGKYIHGDGLFLWGPFGHGKTGAAAVIIMELRRRGYTGLFVEASEYVDKVMQRETFDFETSWSERARDVDVLVLDDLGTEHHDAAGAIERMMEGLLRYRLQRGRVTILTSNISPMKLGPHTEEDRRVDGPYRGKFVEVIREALFPIEVRGRSLREDREQEMATGYQS